MFSCEFCEISKSTFSYRAPPVAAPAYKNDEINLVFYIFDYLVWILKTTRVLKFQYGKEYSFSSTESNKECSF